MKENGEDWIEQLTAEKNLWTIFKKSYRLNETKFNYTCYVLGILVVILQFIFAPDDQRSLHDALLKLTELGLSSSLTILGFLIAGFTIFATISDPELLIQMAMRPKKGTQLTMLKYNFFVFMNVFTIYVCFALWCVLVIIFGQKQGIATMVIHHLPHPRFFGSILVKTVLGSVSLGMIVLLVQLKSFIFNIYHVVMTSIQWRSLENQRTQK